MPESIKLVQGTAEGAAIVKLQLPAVWKSGTVERMLAEHYGFTEEELDFIINYDIKYRMGLSGGSTEEE